MLIRFMRVDRAEAPLRHEHSLAIQRGVVQPGEDMYKRKIDENKSAR